jgi:hypothetical protein
MRRTTGEKLEIALARLRAADPPAYKALVRLLFLMLRPSQK